MPVIIQYLVSLSISLAIVYLFYQLLLRRLTFYQHNRFFLLGYSLFSFLIPLINIGPILDKNAVSGNKWIQQLPTVQGLANGKDTAGSLDAIQYWSWLNIILIGGAILFFLRLITQLISFRRITRHSKLLSADSVRLYQVDRDIIPFSFGKSIYINNQLQNEEELKDVIRHEFVHVMQLHTIDIIWAELLCIVNWYNPASWLIRKAIRQNLEFIADNKVVQSGIDKKQYQYLLLKVMGNNHFAITTKFNFSSLKKRIAMMNKIKTSKVQLLRLLLLLPAIAILLLAFRQQKLTKPQSKQVAETITPNTDEIQEVSDTTKKRNAKGYDITIVDNKGECEIIIKDRKGQFVKWLPLTEWDRNKAHYENLYGKILPPPKVVAPAPPAPPTPPVAEIIEIPIGKAIPPDSPLPPAAPLKEGVGLQEISIPPVPVKPAEMPANVKRMEIQNSHAEVELKNGKVEKYDLSIPEEKAAFEKKYGKVVEAPLPPAEPVEIIPAANSKGYTMVIQNAQKDFLVIIYNENKREVRKVMLAEWQRDKNQFETKYGELPYIPAPMIRTSSPYFEFASKKKDNC